MNCGPHIQIKYHLQDLPSVDFIIQISLRLNSREMDILLTFRSYSCKKLKLGTKVISNKFVSIFCNEYVLMMKGLHYTYRYRCIYLSLLYAFICAVHFFYFSLHMHCTVFFHFFTHLFCVYIYILSSHFFTHLYCILIPHFLNVLCCLLIPHFFTVLCCSLIPHFFTNLCCLLIPHFLTHL